jgi:hypothetical protein
MYGAFVVHPEFKKKGDRHASWKEEQKANRDHFMTVFQADLARKYPHITNGSDFLMQHLGA